MVRSNAYTFVITFVVTVLILGSFVFTVYHLSFLNRVVPGVTLSEIKFGGLNEADVDDRLERLERITEKEWVMTVGGREFMVDNDVLGISFDKNETKKNLFAVGREKGFFGGIGDKVKAVGWGLDITPAFKIDEAVLADFTGKMVAEVNTPYVNAAYVISQQGELEIIPEESGMVVDSGNIKATIMARYASFSQEPVSLGLNKVKPPITVEVLEGRRDEVESFVSRNIVFIHNDKIWYTVPDVRLSMLKVKESTLEIDIVNAEENEFLGNIVNELNLPPRAAVFEEQDGKVVAFATADDGQEVLTQEFRNRIVTLYKDPDTTQVEVPTSVVASKGDGNQYGIIELLGSGTSIYAGSPQGRINNIVLSSSQVSGILVPPGEEFSFLRAVGEVSARTGYDQAYVIVGGRTVLGDGGGVCQVSTTLFRAILNAGFPVTQRVAHSYRVSYYEQDKGPGFDAAVYAPSVDLRFLNDTDHYVLVMSEVDLSQNKITYSIYGTADGREVEVSNAIVHSETPPPEPLYEDDPGLPKGTTEQVEQAVWGANVSITRKVTRNGEVLSEDVFRSNFVPWRAVYSVGTG